MTIAVEDLRRAKRAARLAVSLGLPVTSCPFQVDGDDRQRALATLWIHTYLQHRPPEAGAVDYSG